MKAAEERLGMVVDDESLPLGQRDLPLVLAAGTVLREKARPLLGVRADLYAAGLGNAPNRVTRQHGAHGGFALVEDPRVLRVKRHDEPEHAARMRRDVAVPEIEAEQVRVVDGDERVVAVLVVPAGRTRSSADPPADAVPFVAPPPDGAARDAGRARDLAVVQAAADQPENLLGLRVRAHET